MPIYAYRCSECGHAKDVLQKMSDPVLSDCPACGAAAFTKQVTAAGFQLKGSGWYVTDFRGDGKPAKAAEDGAKDGAKDGTKSEPAKTDAPAAPTPAGKTETSAAPKPAPAAPAPTPAAPAAGAK
jgi:putative FmdB family regulatory protein